VISNDVEARLLSFNVASETALKEADQALSTWARPLDVRVFRVPSIQCVWWSVVGWVEEIS
jgi:hypothetical protein